MLNRGEVVCVTGASGFIGSWIVQLLLRRGYTVHATVRNLGDNRETKHLEAMDEADDSRLRLFQMDLLRYDSIASAVAGAAGVIHVASPCSVDRIHDPQHELLEPAIKGTINVLAAAKELGVRRVVITSSISAMIISPDSLVEAARNEDCWADEETCKQKGLWYPLSKILAEKAAWEFGEKNGVNIVVVNPGTVIGPMISPVINASMVLTLSILQGKEVPPEFFMGFVHVKDVALAHILAYENTAVAGRHLCVESLSQYDDFAATISQLYPEYNVPRKPKIAQNGEHISNTSKKNGEHISNASKKLAELGLEFTSLEEMIKDSVESLRSKGYLS